MHCFMLSVGRLLILMFFERSFSFEGQELSPAKSRIYNEEHHDPRSSQNIKRIKKNDFGPYSNHDDADRRLKVILDFIKEHFSTIWGSLIQAYEENSCKDKSAIKNTEKIFKAVFKTDDTLEKNFRRDQTIKKELEAQLALEKKKEEFNIVVSQMIHEEGIDFLWEHFDAFVTSKDLRISFGDYVIDFSHPDTLFERLFGFFPKSLFHTYFTPLEVLMFSSFLIKKFVKPSTLKNFLNNSFGSNFSKKQGVRYLEKYVLAHSGKLFIGGAMVHALLVGGQAVKK